MSDATWPWLLVLAPAWVVIAGLGLAAAGIQLLDSRAALAGLLLDGSALAAPSSPTA